MNKNENGDIEADNETKVNKSELWFKLDVFYKKISTFMNKHKILTFFVLLYLTINLMNSCSEIPQREVPFEYSTINSGLNKIKINLKDPDSLVVRQLFVAETNEEIVGCLNYKAKNSFNAFIQNRAVISGRKSDKLFFAITEENESFNRLWDMKCENNTYHYFDKTNYYK